MWQKKKKTVEATDSAKFPRIKKRVDKNQTQGKTNKEHFTWVDVNVDVYLKRNFDEDIFEAFFIHLKH